MGKKVVFFGFGLKKNEKGKAVLLREMKELAKKAHVVFVEPEDQAIEKEIVDTDIIVVMKPYLPAKLLRLGKRLKGIIKFGVGVDRIDVNYATGKGIVVTNTAPGLTQSSAEATVTMMLALAKDLIKKIQMVKKGILPRAEDRGTELYGKTLGIIGLGRIGNHVAKLAKVFGMNVIAYDPYVSDDVAKENVVKLVDLKTLLKESDFVSIHAPLTEESRHMIGESELSLMKKTAFLVNLSRGAVVDEESLYRFLKEGKIAGAGLDVWAKEPVLPSNPLTKLSNVIATPHYLCLTWESFRKKARIANDAVLAIISNKRPKYVINPSIYDS